MGRWSGFAGGLMIGGMIAAVSAVVYLRGTGAGTADSEPFGTRLLQEFQCHEAETKIIQFRGIEDNFSPQGDEPARLDPRLAGTRFERQAGSNVYDYAETDQAVQDHFYLPQNTASALLVFRLRANGNNDNDNLFIGDLGAHFESNPAERHVFGTRIRYLADQDNWNEDNGYFWTRFSGIAFGRISPGEDRRVIYYQNPPVTLLDYVRAPDSDGIVGVHVADDTSVDFIAVAACHEPEPGLGLTLADSPIDSVLLEDDYDGAGLAGLTLMSNSAPDEADYASDPYIGDTPCGTELPLACFLPLELPSPASLDDRSEADFYISYWSGGLIAGTAPVAADRFQTIHDAEAYCRAEFGPDWRVLTYHDGGRHSRIMGYGRAVHEPGERAWVDIRGQPYATCWAHPDPHD